MLANKPLAFPLPSPSFLEDKSATSNSFCYSHRSQYKCNSRVGRAVAEGARSLNTSRILRRQERILEEPECWPFTPAPADHVLTHSTRETTMIPPNNRLRSRSPRRLQTRISGPLSVGCYAGRISGI
jgi:hypothetical protein